MTEIQLLVRLALSIMVIAVLSVVLVLRKLMAQLAQNTLRFIICVKLLTLGKNIWSIQ
jgi:hypothetical protein